MNVDFPEWIIEALDKEAKKISVTRQTIIKVWIADRLKEEREDLQANYQKTESVRVSRHKFPADAEVYLLSAKASRCLK